MPKKKAKKTVAARTPRGVAPKKRSEAASSGPAARKAAAARDGAKRAAKKAARTGKKKAGAVAPAARKPARQPGNRLSRADVGRFQELLLAKRRALVGDLKSMETQAFKLSGQDTSANHMADYGSDNYEQDFTLGLIENNEEAVLQIDAALARIDKGTYGVCEGCEQPIPEARLEALPWTGFCVKCQQQQERY